MGFWSRLLKEKAKDWLYAELPPSLGNRQQKLVELQSEYMTITLKSMRIMNIRVPFTKFYGAIKIFKTLDHMNGKPAEFNIVITPAKLKEPDPKNLDLIITAIRPCWALFLMKKACCKDSSTSAPCQIKRIKEPENLQ
jgi:hypothetical protein